LFRGELAGAEHVLFSIAAIRLPSLKNGKFRREFFPAPISSH